jgi:RNA polymerase sigma factor (sigma-70 family)
VVPRQASGRPRAELQLLLDARHGRSGARAQLIREFTPLMGSVARTYAHVPCVDRAELMQEGVVGLLRALERFDLEMGTPFWAYASWWVRQAMQQLVAELSRPVVLSDRALRQLALLREARREFVARNSREPSMGELSEGTDLSLGQLRRLLVAERQPRGLEEPVDEAALGGATFGELLADPEAEEAYELLPMRLAAAEVPRLLQRLNGRERRVIEARYGLGERERTLRELGQSIGVSAERVRQIEQDALEKMRAGERRPASRARRHVPRRAGASR